MALRKKSRAALEAQLREIEDRLSRHPLASTRVREAHALIDAHPGEDPGRTSRKLAEKGLPELDELGALQLKSSISWWRLNRSKRKVTKKLASL